MTEEEEKHCEAYYCIEEESMDHSKKIIIQGIGRTPDEAWDLFQKVWKKMIRIGNRKNTRKTLGFIYEV